MATERRKWRSLLAAVALSLLVTLVEPSTSDTIDATDLGVNVSDSCNGGMVPVGVTAVEEEGRVTVSWTSLQASPPDPEQLGFQILYRPSCSTLFNSTTVAINDRSFVFEPDLLLRFTTYIFVVRVECLVAMETIYSNASSEARVATPATAPGAVVQGLVVNTSFEGVRNLVRMSWQPLPEDSWNGMPLGYYIYLFRDPRSNPMRQQDKTYSVVYPSTSLIVGLADGEYAIQVVPFNNVALGGSVQEEFIVGQNSTVVEEERPVLDYPYIYIIIPGLFCIVIIVVVTIVIFKKTVENKKRGVAYVQDLESKLNGNAIPLNNLSPQSPSTSVSLSVAATATTPSNAPAGAAVGMLNPLAQRPLPLSPTPSNQPPMPQSFQFNSETNQAALSPSSGVGVGGGGGGGGGEGQFGNGLAPNHQVPRKLPHPGPQPKLQDASMMAGGKLEGGGAGGGVIIPIKRTMTSQSTASSVFGPTGGSVIVQTQKKPPPQTTRGRSKTVSGGMPSPYEVPEGSTISRSDASSSAIRPNSAHQHHSQQIPPPPSHSPPPLNQSSMEMRAFLSDKKNRQPKVSAPMIPGGQNTLPRAMPTQRSYSTSHADQFSTAAKQMKSEGNLPILESSEEKLIYIRPPLDSSVENSIHSSSSFGGGGGGGGELHRKNSSDRGSSANSNRQYYSLEQPPLHHQQQQQQQQQKNVNMGFSPGGMNNGSMTSSDQFSSYSESTNPPGPAGSASGVLLSSGRLPPPHHLAPTIHEQQEHEFHHPHPSNVTRGGVGGGGAIGRESIFSETSTELSISSTSGSLRETSPGFSWEQPHPRAVVSDVGMVGIGGGGGAGQRRRRSHSPERETFSDVGGVANTAHHVFKKAPHPPPLPTAYTSPASIISSTQQTPHSSQDFRYH